MPKRTYKRNTFGQFARSAGATSNPASKTKSSDGVGKVSNNKSTDIAPQGKPRREHKTVIHSTGGSLDGKSGIIKGGSGAFVNVKIKGVGTKKVHRAATVITPLSKRKSR
jgi:hypothetical protein